MSTKTRTDFAKSRAVVRDRSLFQSDKHLNLTLIIVPVIDNRTGSSHRKLTREPSYLERSPGQQVALGLAEVVNGGLDAFYDLILIIH
jgi:hypothetical protein